MPGKSPAAPPAARGQQRSRAAAPERKLPLVDPVDVWRAQQAVKALGRSVGLAPGSILEAMAGVNDLAYHLEAHRIPEGGIALRAVRRGLLLGLKIYAHSAGRPLQWRMTFLAPPR